MMRHVLASQLEAPRRLSDQVNSLVGSTFFGQRYNDVVQLCSLHELRTLRLPDAGVTGAGIKSACSSKILSVLGLRGTTIKGNRLEETGMLTPRYLDIGGTNEIGEGVIQLATTATGMNGFNSVTRLKRIGCCAINRSPLDVRERYLRLFYRAAGPLATSNCWQQVLTTCRRIVTSETQAMRIDGRAGPATDHTEPHPRRRVERRRVRVSPLAQSACGEKMSRIGRWPRHLSLALSEGRYRSDRQLEWAPALRHPKKEQREFGTLRLLVLQAKTPIGRSRFAKRYCPVSYFPERRHRFETLAVKTIAALAPLSGQKANQISTRRLAATICRRARLCTLGHRLSGCKREHRFLRAGVIGPRPNAQTATKGRKTGRS